MRVTIRTEGFRFALPIPIPVSLAGAVVRLLPDRLFQELGQEVPEPYRVLVAKEYILLVLDECLDVLKENRGLEVVHVDASDGTFVSVIL